MDWWWTIDTAEDDQDQNLHGLCGLTSSEEYTSDERLVFRGCNTEWHHPPFGSPLHSFLSLQMLQSVR